MWTKEDKNNFLKTLGVLFIVLILSIIGKIYFHEEKHFAFEKIPFFEGIFGLLGALFLTIVVKITGHFVSRKEDSYDRYYTS